MQLEKRARTTVYVVTVLYSLLLLAFGIQVPSLAGKIISFLPTLIVLMWLAFDTWLWRQGLVLKYVKHPLLVGTWIGALTSYRRDEGGSAIETEHPVIVVIRQTYTAVSVTLMSAESKSRSAAAEIKRFDSDDYALMYQYENKPGLRFRDGSPIHTGGATIEISGRAPTTIEGEYWTARESRGTFTVTLKSRKVAGTFDEGMGTLPEVK